MAKIIKTPEALLRTQDNSVVAVGDVVAPNPGDHRQLEIASSVPDNDGLLTIREVRKVRPEDMGLYIRPASTTVVLSEDEAAVILPQLHAETVEPTPVYRTATVPVPERQDFHPSPQEG